ncbi:hypothetical protein GGR54DRAFT_592094, partial [Hypoxylon sp. NC1633]
MHGRIQTEPDTFLHDPLSIAIRRFTTTLLRQCTHRSLFLVKIGPQPVGVGIGSVGLKVENDPDHQDHDDDLAENENGDQLLKVVETLKGVLQGELSSVGVRGIDKDVDDSLEVLNAQVVDMDQVGHDRLLTVDGLILLEESTFLQGEVVQQEVLQFLNSLLLVHPKLIDVLLGLDCFLHLLGLNRILRIREGSNGGLCDDSRSLGGLFLGLFLGRKRGTARMLRNGFRH